MEIAAILLTFGVIILVGLYLYAPLLERQGRRVTVEEHELSSLLAERDRVVNSLQELDFDFNLGKIPEGDYPAQRASLLQKGADILRGIDSFSPNRAEPFDRLRAGSASGDEASAQDTESRIEKAVAARRADASVKQAELTDDDLESMIVSRRKNRKSTSAGFCPKCGKPVLTTDKFCPSCGKSLS
ncbi:MAG: zinc ribbon domain-containing protein [Anaerolineales bacterium]|nr:zinc ribbon domain-containing protein [Anaerolineales bacterium]